VYPDQDIFDDTSASIFSTVSSVICTPAWAGAQKTMHAKRPSRNFAGRMKIII
jgi:hypothetical protein